jgi:hypothetical protein
MAWLFVVAGIRHDHAMIASLLGEPLAVENGR